MITFVRHGETAHNRDGRLQGRVDLELSDTGLDQAARVAARFSDAKVDRIFTSPLRRALQTATAIAEVCGAEVEIDERLIELDYGEWDGRPLDEIRPDARLPVGVGSDVRAAGRREPRRGRRRVSRRSAATASAPTTASIAVSHVSPIKAAVCWALGVDERATLRMHLGLASITRIGARADGGVFLSSFNDCAHLKS